MTARLAAAALAAFVLGCATTKEAEAPAGPPPELVSQDLDLQQQIDAFTITFNGVAKSEAAATIQHAHWEMVVDGKVVKSGEEPLNVAIPAGGTAPFTLKAESKYVSSADELKAISERGGSLLTSLRGKVSINQGGKNYDVDFARGREVRTPRMPSVKMHELDAARYSDAEANILFSLGVVNPNPFDLKLTELTYKLEIAGKPVADGTRANGDSVSPASTGVYEVQGSVSEATVGKEVKALIKSQSLPYVITGELKGDLFTIPYKLDGTVKLNVSK